MRVGLSWSSWLSVWGVVLVVFWNRFSSCRGWIESDQIRRTYIKSFYSYVLSHQLRRSVCREGRHKKIRSCEVAEIGLVLVPALGLANHAPF